MWRLIHFDRRLGDSLFRCNHNMLSIKPDYQQYYTICVVAFMEWMNLCKRCERCTSATNMKKVDFVQRMTIKWRCSLTGWFRLLSTENMYKDSRWNGSNDNRCLNEMAFLINLHTNVIIHLFVWYYHPLLFIQKIDTPLVALKLN